MVLTNLCPTWLRDQEGYKTTKDKCRWERGDKRHCCHTGYLLLLSVSLAQGIRVNIRQDRASINSRDCLDSSVQAQPTAIQCEEQPACHLLRTEKSIPMIKHQGGKGNTHCCLDIGMTFLWNWRLPGVCGNLGKGTITSISSGQEGNLLLGRVCPPQAWGCRGN